MLILSHAVTTDRFNGVALIDPNLKLSVRQHENHIIERLKNENASLIKANTHLKHELEKEPSTDEKLRDENKELKIMNSYLRKEIKVAKRLLSEK